MSTPDPQPRGDLLDAMAEAINRIAAALADLGGAYELLDEPTGDRLEAELFKPVQTAYGRAQRAHAAFAARSGIPARSFSTPASGAPSRGVDGLVEAAVEALEEADGTFVSLQDTLILVEYGDEELRAAVSEVRRLMDEAMRNSVPFLSTLGR